MPSTKSKSKKQPSRSPFTSLIGEKEKPKTRFTRAELDEAVKAAREPTTYEKFQQAQSMYDMAKLNFTRAEDELRRSRENLHFHKQALQELSKTLKEEAESALLIP